jgi:hypothetical protein
MKPDYLPLYLKWQKTAIRGNREDVFLSFVVNLIIDRIIKY